MLWLIVKFGSEFYDEAVREPCNLLQENLEPLQVFQYTFKVGLLQELTCESFSP